MARRKPKQYKLTNGVVYDLHLTGDTHVHISSGNEKIGKGIYNLSLLPGDEPLKRKDGLQLTNIAGTCHGCCDGCGTCCYAKRSVIQHHNVNIKAWGENTMLAREDTETFFAEVQTFIDRNVVSVFRVHVGGEFFSYAYMKRWVEFAAKNPDVIFYVYTKRFGWIEKVDEEYNGVLPDNFRVLVSIWHKNYSNPRGFAEFIYDDGTEPELKDVVHCPAVDKHGHETGVTCSMCKRCIKAKKGTRTAVYAH